MPRRTRIGPDGNLIQDGDESGTGGSGNSSGGGRRRLFSCPPRLPHRVDTFGFHLDIKHFVIVLILVSITMGSAGLMLFLSFLTMYTYFQRQTSSSSTSSSSSSSSGGAKWKDGKATGSNIKGVGDLPKPPKG